MRQCHLLYKIIFILCFCSLPSWAGQFLIGTEDVPLMKEMTYSQEETFSFDNEEGRLYFSKVFTPLKPSQIMEFYRQTLPQLGWREKNDASFEREGDVLNIGVIDGEYHSLNQTSVIFELITKSK